MQPPYREEYDACGCFEYYASGNGIGARVRDAVRANKAYKGKLRKKPICRISAYDVFSACPVSYTHLAFIATADYFLT